MAIGRAYQNEMIKPTGLEKRKEGIELGRPHKGSKMNLMRTDRVKINTPTGFREE